jgi:hypothetical protein
MPPKRSNEIKISNGKTLPDCCDAKTGVCQRKSDKKPFDIKERKYTKEECLGNPKPKGFTARASCAPYKDCARK